MRPTLDEATLTRRRDLARTAREDVAWYERYLVEQLGEEAGAAAWERLGAARSILGLCDQVQDPAVITRAAGPMDDGSLAWQQHYAEQNLRRAVRTLQRSVNDAIAVHRQGPVRAVAVERKTWEVPHVGEHPMAAFERQGEEAAARAELATAERLGRAAQSDEERRHAAAEVMKAGSRLARITGEGR